MKKNIKDFYTKECGVSKVARVKSIFKDKKIPFELAYFYLAPGEETIEHNHIDQEIFICLEGEGQYSVNGNMQKFGSHDIWFVNENEYHKITNKSKNVISMIAVWWV